MIRNITKWMVAGLMATSLFFIMNTGERICVASGDSGANAQIARLRNDRVGVAFDLARGTYDLVDVASGQAVVKGARAEVAEWVSSDASYTRTAKTGRISDELGKGRSLTVECAAAGKPSLLLEFRVYDGNEPFTVLRGGWKNTGREPLSVKEFRPLAGGSVFPGGAWSDVRTLTSNSGCNDPRVLRSPYASSANNLLLTVRRDGARRSLVLGALKTADFTKWMRTLPESGLGVRGLALRQALPKSRLAAYLDCGERTRNAQSQGPAIQLVQGSAYDFPNPFPRGNAGEPLASVVFHERAVTFDAAGLNPASHYVLGFSWWDANADGRKGSVIVTGEDGKPRILAEKLPLPSQTGPKEYALAIPREALAGGAFKLAFANEAPVPNIVVSEVWLWETEAEQAVPQEWLAGHNVSAPEESSAQDMAAKATLEASDPVGKRVDAGETYLPEDSFYVDFLTPDPFEALEKYGWRLRLAMRSKPNPYDIPTVCAWYAGVWKTPGAQDHPDKSTYKINTTSGSVEEAAEIGKTGFLNYSRAAVRLVPDNYTPNNPQGWWDDEHWRIHGLYTAPYETSAKFGKGMRDNGCLAFTYIQALQLSQDFRESHREYLRGKDLNAPLDYSRPAVQQYIRSRFAALRGNIDGFMVDYCDEFWQGCSGGKYADPKMTATAFYRMLFTKLREGIGPDARIHERSLGQPNNDLTLDLTDSQRTEGDTDKISPAMVTRSGLRWYKNRVVRNYDMDSKELNSSWRIDGWNGSDQDGRRMMLTMAYVAASRLLLANSFRDLSKETLRDLTRTFPYPTEPRSARPVDAFVHEGYPRVYDFAVTPDWRQLTLFNNTLPTRTETISVKLAGEQASGALGLDPAKEYYVYDFWNDRFSGRIKGSDTLVQELRPGEARMLAIHAVEPNPQFLATDRHVMQGYLDLIERPVWSGARKTLSGASRVVSRDPYRIILATNGFRIASASAKGAAAKTQILDAAGGLAVLTLESPRNADASWIVKFE